MNQITAYEKINDAKGIQLLGDSIALSGMFGCDKPEQGIIIALQCMAENKPPLELAKHYHIIKGKLTKRADAMLADFRKAGGKFIFEDLKNPKCQKARIEFEDYKGLQVEYSIEDAKAAGVYNTKADSPWQKTPAAMLRARLVSETLRAIAPEIVTGVYTPEEAYQFDEDTGERYVAKSLPKPDPKAKASPAPKQAEVVETEIIESEPTTKEKLEIEIDKAKAEEIINDYFVIKGMIDGKTQTWRDLDGEVHSDMLDDFAGLLAAAREVQG